MGNVIVVFGGCYLMNNCTNDLIALRIHDNEQCPNDCSENGVCRNGRCICKSGYVNYGV